MRSLVTVAVAYIVAMSSHIAHKSSVLIVRGKSGDVFTQLGAASLCYCPSAPPRHCLSLSLSLTLCIHCILAKFVLASGIAKYNAESLTIDRHTADTHEPVCVSFIDFLRIAPCAQQRSCVSARISQRPKKKKNLKITFFFRDLRRLLCKNMKYTRIFARHMCMHIHYINDIH